MDKCKRPTGTCKCGLANTRNVINGRRIMGGNPTKENQYPWMVALTLDGKRKNSSNCGGSLIDDRTVLTAAHCVCDQEDPDTGDCTAFVSSDRLGVWVGLQDWRVQDKGQEYIRVEKRLEHPYYIGDSNSMDNDLALLKLNKRVKWRKEAQPICLPEIKSDFYEGDMATVIGWGNLGSRWSGRLSRWIPTYPDELQEVDVKIISNKQCSKIYENVTTEYNNTVTITSNMLCAAEENGNGGNDSCGGDSGGPLFVERNGVDFNGEKQYEQVGVVSFGEQCLKPPHTLSSAGVYARVTARIDWIKNHMFGETCH